MLENCKSYQLGLTLKSRETMPSDIEMEQQAKLVRIAGIIREKLDSYDEYLEPYGYYNAKITLPYLDVLRDKPKGLTRPSYCYYSNLAGKGIITTTVERGDTLNYLLKSNHLFARTISWTFLELKVVQQIVVTPKSC